MKMLACLKAVRQPLILLIISSLVLGMGLPAATCDIIVATIVVLALV